MVADMLTILARVVAFLGWSALPEAVAAAIDATRFERLRAEEERLGFGEKPPHMERFFRRGETGSWRTVLTRGQVARIEQNHGSTMVRLGYL